MPFQNAQMWHSICGLQKLIGQRKEIETERAECEVLGPSIADRRACFERGELGSQEEYNSFNRASAESKTRKASHNVVEPGTVTETSEATKTEEPVWSTQTQTKEADPMLAMAQDNTNEADEPAGDRELAVPDAPAVGVYDLSSAVDGCLEDVLNNLRGTDGESEAVETKSESEDGDSESVHEVDMNGFDRLDLWPERKALGANQEQQVLKSSQPDEDCKTEEQVPTAAIETGTETTTNEGDTPAAEEKTTSTESNEKETNPSRTPPVESQSIEDTITVETTAEERATKGSHEVDTKTEEQVPTEEAGENAPEQTVAAPDLTEEAEQTTEACSAPEDHSTGSPVNIETEEQVEAKIEEQVETDTEEQFDIDTEEQVGTDTEEQVEAKIEEQVGTDTDEPVETETEEQADIETEEQVDTKTEEHMETETEEQVDTKTEEKVPIPVQEVVRPKELQPVNETKTEEQVPPWPNQRQTEPDSRADQSEDTQEKQPKQNEDMHFSVQQLVSEEEEDQGPLSVILASQHELPAAEEAQEAMAKVTKELEMQRQKESEQRHKALKKELEREKKIEARRERVQKYVEQDRERKALAKQRRQETAIARKEWEDREKGCKRAQQERRAQQRAEQEIKYQRHIAKIKKKQEKAKSVWKPVQKCVMLLFDVV